MLGVFESSDLAHTIGRRLVHVLVVLNILGRPFHVSHTLSVCRGWERQRTSRYDVGRKRWQRGQGSKQRRGRHASRLWHSTHQDTGVRRHTPSHVGCARSPPTAAALRLSSSLSVLQHDVNVDVSFPLPRFPRPSPGRFKARRRFSTLRMLFEAFRGRNTVDVVRFQKGPFLVVKNDPLGMMAASTRGRKGFSILGKCA